MPVVSTASHDLSSPPKTQSVSVLRPILANSPSSMPKAKWSSIRFRDNPCPLSLTPRFSEVPATPTIYFNCFNSLFRTLEKRSKHRRYFSRHATQACASFSQSLVQFLRTLCRAKHFLYQFPLTQKPLAIGMPLVQPMPQKTR